MPPQNQPRRDQSVSEFVRVPEWHALAAAGATRASRRRRPDVAQSRRPRASTRARRAAEGGAPAGCLPGLGEQRGLQQGAHY